MRIRNIRRTVAVSAAFLSCSLLLLTHASAPAADSAGSQLASAAKLFLDAYNRPNSGAMASWACEHLTPRSLAHMPPDAWERYYGRVYKSTGTLAFMNAPSYHTHEIDVIVRSAQGKQGELRMAESASVPGKIGAVFMFPAPDESRIPKLPSSAVDADALPATIDEYVCALHAQEAFSGVVLVARNHKVVFQGAYGLANRKKGIPVTPTTQFGTASLGKMFAAVAIGQLVEQGKLRLDETLAEALPSYPNSAAAQQITVANLLEHSSGIPDYFTLGAKARAGAVYDRPADYFPIFASEPLSFKPGSRFLYSNSEFVVLGAIVEYVSGEEYFSYVKRHIFEPAGMTDTVRGDEAAGPLAVNYAYADDDPMGFRGLATTTAFYTRPYTMRPTSSGGFASTATDIERFYAALQSGHLLSASTLTVFTKPRFDVDPARKYGYGFEIDEFSDGTAIGHSGGGEGSGVDVWSGMLGDGTTDLIVFANQDVPAGMRVYRELAAFLLKQPTTSP
jgi:CubicO group peptidase (beta-lactamase class C family)